MKKVVIHISVCAVLTASTAGATSFADGEHYEDFVRRFGHDPMTPRITQDQMYRGFDVSCPYPIGSGRCRSGSGSAVGVGGGGGGGGGGGNKEAYEESPEDQRERKGSLVGGARDLYEFGKEKGAKFGIKRGLKHAVNQLLTGSAKWMVGGFIGIAVDVFWPTQLANNDVLPPPNKKKKKKELIDSNGKVLGNTEVDPTWDPSDARNPQMRPQNDRPTIQKEADSNDSKDTTKEDVQPDKGSNDNNSNDSGSGDTDSDNDVEMHLI